MRNSDSFREICVDSGVNRKTKHGFEELSKKIIGAAIEVHRELGPGFLENIYERALKLELTEHNIRFDSQKDVRIKYLGVEVGQHRLDLIIENQIVLELKAVKELTDAHFSQLRSYLKATGLKVGLLFNFAKPTLEIKRVVN